MGKLKIVYPICYGMDVHRDFVIACIATTNAQGVTEYQSRRFSLQLLSESQSFKARSSSMYVYRLQGRA